MQWNKEMSKKQLLILITYYRILVIIHTVESGNVHFITPSPSTQCSGESCLNLATLTANSENHIFSSNTTLVLLEDHHSLHSKLVLSNINGSITLSTNGSGTAAIICSGKGGLEFFGIT